MNEASSKYVDQIATEKLILEKLSLVHHTPGSNGLAFDINLNGVDQQPVQSAGLVERLNGMSGEITFPSAIQTEYAENNLVRCKYWFSGAPQRDLIFVHGLYEDNLEIYRSLISLLNEQGINVYLLILPYHYGRKPQASLFSGEYFWSGNIQRSVQAYLQAVYDLYQLYSVVSQRSGRPVWIAGFSMGGGVLLTLATKAALQGIFAINPVCNLIQLVWTSALFAGIRRDLEESGWTFDKAKAAFSGFEPLCADPLQAGEEKVILACSLYDQINDPGNYDLLIHKWGLKNILKYKAGHLNVLRVPRLAADIAQFCMESRQNELL
jgi:pimeloyl-ACP methyl ester carboxylesterase